MRLLLAATCLSLSILIPGCNQSASSNSAPANNQSAQPIDRPTITQPSSNTTQESTQETNIAQADRSEQSQSATILDGRYSVGHTGQGLEVDGDRYRYRDEEGKQPWRSITELTAIKDGVLYDGKSHWCLSTMKPKGKISSCSKDGWVVYQPSTPDSTVLKIPALGKEMFYGQARQLIINAGWQPLVTTSNNPHDGTKFWRDRGYNEVTSCSGTGMGFCRFEFTGSGDQKLVVVTGGRESTLQKWWEETVDRTAPVKQSNLPFVGKRAFNFLGGSGTGYTITIESNGNTIIQGHGTMRSSTIYQGPFQETMEGITIKDGYADNCAGRSADEDPEVKRLAPCKAKLY